MPISASSGWTGAVLKYLSIVGLMWRGNCKTPFLFFRLSPEYLRTHPDTSFQNFPKRSTVIVTHVAKAHIPVLSRPPIADVVTHVSLGRWAVRRVELAAVPQLPLLPNLAGLTVLDYPFDPAFPLPLSLIDLYLGDPVPRAKVDALTRFTNLTSLRLSIWSEGERTFEALTVISALRRLSLVAGPSMIPFVGGLTLLTYLHLNRITLSGLSSDLELSPLTHLQKLVHLEIGPDDIDLTLQQYKSIALITSLQSLHLDILRDPQRRLTSIFQIPFTCLVLKCVNQDKSYLSHIKYGGLRDLGLGCMREVGWEGVAALRRARGLTQLRLSYQVRGAGAWPGHIGLAVGSMSRLRALSLESFEQLIPECVNAIGRLTKLTSLKWAGKYVTNGVQVWTGLKELRMLSILSQTPAPSDRITADTFMALAKLPELRRLTMRSNFETYPFNMTEEIRNLVNAERHSRGWPPLELTLTDIGDSHAWGSAKYAPIVVRWELDHKFRADNRWAD